MSEKPFNLRKWLGLDSPGEASAKGCGDGCGDGGCGGEAPGQDRLHRPVDRRKALGLMLGGVTAAAGVAHAAVGASSEDAEKKRLEWEEMFKGNYRLMTPDEQKATVQRLERIGELQHGRDIHVSAEPARPGTLWGYAFNISTCRGYRECVKACVAENNQDRSDNMQYIRMFEMKNGALDFAEAKADFDHMVPAEGHFYVGTQCMQCENPPCVKVCPVGATWKERDGIIVVDYDWCIGCRYCEAACPYWARRFNWHEPVVPDNELNPEQHYLGNRPRTKGVMEKCTFCVQRTRQGKLPACAEACPTGARIFGNLLDPESEIRWVLANKKVFRLKEDLGTEPKFWYFMD